jgi:hypothetical protein
MLTIHNVNMYVTNVFNMLTMHHSIGTDKHKYKKYFIFLSMLM